MQRLFLISLVLYSGCSLTLPQVKPPKLDTAAAADGALAEFDTDQDGSISREEGKACVGVAQHWERYDLDFNDAIDKSELESRFAEWSNGDTGLMNLRVQVTYRRQELPDAVVKLTPYDFLGENFLPAEGTTDTYGYAFAAIPKDLLPKSQQTTHGMQIGLYRVSITHPSIDLDANYNSKSKLSVDLSSDEANTGISFALK